MNILQRYQEYQLAKSFNSAIIKGMLTVDCFSFDIRIAGNVVFCNGLSVEDFLDECMLDSEERKIYYIAINQWVKNNKI